MSTAARVSTLTSFGLVVLLFAGLSSAQVFEEMSVAHTCSYFGEHVPDKVTTFASDQEAEGVIKRIVDASGLVQNFQIRAAGVPNAAAVIQGETRYILYSQHFMQTTRTTTRSQWAPISIMAHEVGHHLNGHTLDRRGSRPRIELEADYYSGFIVQRMGGSLDDALAAMSALGSETGSETHPAKRDRLAAISNGWTKACESDPRCGSGADSGNQESERPARRTEQKPERRNDPDSCEYARDGECDEPDLCEVGTDTTDCRAVTRGGGRSDQPMPDVRQQPLYCCDQFGRKWCQITVNPGPPGTPCVCAGVPGSGWMCH